MLHIKPPVTPIIKASYQLLHVKIRCNFRTATWAQNMKRKNEDGCWKIRYLKYKMMASNRICHKNTTLMNSSLTAAKNFRNRAF